MDRHNHRAFLKIEQLEQRSFRQEQVFGRVLDLLETNAAAGRP